MDVRQEYLKFARTVEAAIRPVRALHQNAIRCRIQCAECCMEFSLLAVEAELVRLGFTELTARTQSIIRSQAREENRACPFLINRLCSIYQYRPLICRTQGLPVGYLDHERETVEVSACLHNFPAGTNFTIDELLAMDELNSGLVKLNTSYLNGNRSGSASAARLPMRELIRNS